MTDTPVTEDEARRRDDEGPAYPMERELPTVSRAELLARSPELLSWFEDEVARRQSEYIAWANAPVEVPGATLTVGSWYDLVIQRYGHEQGGNSWRNVRYVGRVSGHLRFERWGASPTDSARVHSTARKYIQHGTSVAPSEALLAAVAARAQRDAEYEARYARRRAMVQETDS